MAAARNWFEASTSRWVRRDGAYVSAMAKDEWQAVLVEDDQNGAAVYERTILKVDVTAKEVGGGQIHWFKSNAKARAWLDEHRPMPPRYAEVAFPVLQPNEPRLDPVGDLLIAKGLVPNEFLLDLNRCLTTPDAMDLPFPWSLPSRLFRFPVRVTEVDDAGERQCFLVTPALVEHPFVQQVDKELAEIGRKIVGMDDLSQEWHGMDSRWHHAIDLMTEEHWRDLLVTAHFTTPAMILGAVKIALHSRGITTRTARKVMHHLGKAEPGKRFCLLHDLMAPMLMKNSDTKEDGSYAPVNGPISSNYDQADLAWTFIHCIENSLFEYSQAGFLRWSSEGMKVYADGPQEVLVSANGQAAFAF